MTDIEQALQYIDCSTLSYTEWIQVGMAVKEAGMGCEVWDAWSAQDSGRYHPGDCEKKWDSFGGASQPITQAYIFKLAKDNGWRKYDGNDETLEWDGVIEYDGDTKDTPKWNPVDDFKRYLRALFQPDEYISWVTEAKQDEDGKWKPAGKGTYWKTCADTLKQLDKHPEDICDTIGDYSHEAGAWIRFNPVNGEGVNNSNVTAYRFALVESDTMALDAQYRMYRKLNLPIAAMVTSGGKSIHAIVHIDAANAAEYRERVELLYTILENHGMVVDTQNKNPSRLSRLPGCVRGNSRQTLVETNVGCASWDAWLEYNKSNAEELPNIVPLSEALIDPPPLADVLIDGILRKGHKMLISGPSKAGKSFFLMELAIALANGDTWIGFQCRKSRVLYVNFEIDEASCINRFIEIRKAIFERRNIRCDHMDDLLVWNLRGYAMKLDDLVPKLVARAKDLNLDVILVDPIYKVITGDENSASDMAAFCNEFDRIATLLKCSVIYCHHHSKGSQGFKKAMDRASGSGVFARDPDAQLDMLEIEPPDDCMDKTTDTAWQIESSLREFPNIIPKRIWFRYPLHEEEYNGELKHQPIADGGKNGRPKKIDDDKIEMYFKEYAVDGLVNPKELAEVLQISEQSVKKYNSKQFTYDKEKKGLRRVDR
ncbi:MAG: AAA family ATPase [Bacteroidaceae bacterium]|nr:AAA family ATPase [Bacteroidaceae bacterium]